MSEQLEIFSLAQKLTDPRQTENDMRDALLLVTGMFRERYINRISDNLALLKERSLAEPPKEVALLRSLKPFMAEQTHERIDRMVDALIMFDTISKIRADNNAIHPDGVYEMDYDCLSEKSQKEPT